jgi:hypothetical protein
MHASEIVRWLAGLVVVGFAAFLIGLAALIIVRPAVAERFIRRFASSAVTHYAEQALRLLVGAALVAFADSMRATPVFKLFGWAMVASTLALLVLPWRWHQQYGTWAIPLVIRRFWVFAAGAFALGAFVLWGASRAIAS